MGYDVRIFNYAGEGTKYSLINRRVVDFNFEMWVQSQGTADYNTYVLQDRSVLDVGALGVIGRSGWFIPVRRVGSGKLFAWKKSDQREANIILATVCPSVRDCLIHH